MAVIKVILPLSQLPDGARITKITGQKVYTVHDSIKIYSESSTMQQTLQNDGMKFLMSDDGMGNINVHLDSYEVLWHVQPHELDEIKTIIDPNWDDW